MKYLRLTVLFFFIFSFSASAGIVHSKTKKSSDTPYYWSNYKSEELTNVEGDEEWTIEMKCSEDGNKFRSLWIAK